MNKEKRKKKRYEKYKRLRLIENNNYKNALEHGELKEFSTILEYAKKHEFNLKPSSRVLLGNNCKSIENKLKEIGKILPVYYKKEKAPEGKEYSRNFGYRKDKSRIWPNWILNEVFFGGKR